MALECYLSYTNLFVTEDINVWFTNFDLSLKYTTLLPQVAENYLAILCIMLLLTTFRNLLYMVASLREDAP